ncbi:AAA family ATPase [Methylorubrum populi]|uniref:AAA family ATPase n=1 Tax=Methylorubrum populi TaxID=223967 RepID=UPI0031F8B574
MKTRISEIRVAGLQEIYNYTVKFPDSSDVVIIIAPNGFGKTALLALLNSCLQFKLAEAASKSFSTLDILFDNGTRWRFEKTRERRVTAETDKRHAIRYKRQMRPREWVKVIFYDRSGREIEDVKVGGVDAIPPDLLYRTLDRSLPISRYNFDTFLDAASGEILNVLELINKYKNQLINDEYFKEGLGSYSKLLFSSNEDFVNCVFIETQRLLYSKKANPQEPNSSSVTEEEVTRQSKHLSTLLKNTYSDYAATSQALDRSFPSRLITRASMPNVKDVTNLRSELDSIEKRRSDLTKAGILVETSEPLIAPKDEFLGNVADALAIYVEDSRAKLSTFDALYPKVSVFKNLLNKKLAPKELHISQAGANIRRGTKEINLEGLSSGEKHEFIMLFRLVFETPPNSLVLIDEPEISLHVLWQLEFMSDLMDIQGANPFQAIIATHSPQIFEGVEGLIVDLADQV